MESFTIGYLPTPFGIIQEQSVSCTDLKTFYSLFCIWHCETALLQMSSWFI